MSGLQIRRIRFFMFVIDISFGVRSRDTSIGIIQEFEWPVQVNKLGKLWLCVNIKLSGISLDAISSSNNWQTSSVYRFSLNVPGFSTRFRLVKLALHFRVMIRKLASKTGTVVMSLIHKAFHIVVTWCQTRLHYFNIYPKVFNFCAYRQVLRDLSTNKKKDTFYR